MSWKKSVSRLVLFFLVSPPECDREGEFFFSFTFEAHNALFSLLPFSFHAFYLSLGARTLKPPCRGPNNSSSTMSDAYVPCRGRGREQQRRRRKGGGGVDAIKRAAAAAVERSADFALPGGRCSRRPRSTVPISPDASFDAWRIAIQARER